MDSQINNNDKPADILDENYSFNGHTYTYTDKISNIVYTWDLEKNTWVDKSNSENVTCSNYKETPKNQSKSRIPDDEEEEDSDEEVNKAEPKKQDMSKGVYSYEGDTYVYKDSTDGTKYFWDKEKSAWFPKIDDDFIAYYQMSYGFTQPEIKTDKSPVQSSNKEPENISKNEPENISKNEPENISKNTAESDANLKRKAATEPPTWFHLDDEHNTKVYVTNLPSDITETEFVDLMQKCGLIMKDVDTGKMKIKLYADPETKYLKGDALCTYIKKESVDLALNLLDGYDVRGHRINVEKARFQMKGNAYDPNLKPKKKRRKDKEKLKKMQERLFAWQPDKLRGERPKNERVVVLKNLFDPSLFDNNLSLILEYRQDLREECSKCGTVKKVVIYDKHPDGVAQISFEDAEAADACVLVMNNRWFSQRKLTAETWDGKTRYKIQETPEEEEARLKKWEEFLNTNKEGKSDENEEENKLIIPNENNANPNEKNDENESSIPDEENVNHDSDGTRSSAGSGDETDEEKGD